MFEHYVPKEAIIEEMNEAGYQLQEDLDCLPEQSFTKFSLQEWDMHVVRETTIIELAEKGGGFEPSPSGDISRNTPANSQFFRLMMAL